ncbi:hypothetical protein [Brevibacterium siliguriense]|nr:hypothetical protein [Brevibacterium siliguriense]
MHVIPRCRDKDKDRLRLPFEPGVRGNQDLIGSLASSMRESFGEG